MKYEKESFCAGIAVGAQLKGWASVGGVTDAEAYDGTIIITDSVAQAEAADESDGTTDA